MRSEIKPGVKFPDYELPDHTGNKRKLSFIQGFCALSLFSSKTAKFCSFFKLPIPKLSLIKIPIKGCYINYEGQLYEKNLSQVQIGLLVQKKIICAVNNWLKHIAPFFAF